MLVEHLPTAATAHWHNFLYRTEARHWRSLWCRWSPSGDLVDRFEAERIFEPLEDRDSCTQRNVYHYSDDRGSVREGPLCGPWVMTAEACATDVGIVHPARQGMSTLLAGPGGPCAWCSTDTASGLPCFAELFLHHGEELRMSAGIIHSSEGQLERLALIREDAATWPSSGWTGSDEARVLPNAAACVEALCSSSRDSSLLQPGRTGSGHAIFASGLRQEELQGVEWRQTLMARADADATSHCFMLLDEGSVALVSPKWREAGRPFGSAAAWSPRGGGKLYYVEASWDGAGAVKHVRHLVFG